MAMATATKKHGVIVTTGKQFKTKTVSMEDMNRIFAQKKTNDRRKHCYQGNPAIVD